MSELAIRVENVSKLYRIGVRDTYRTLRDALVNATKRPLQRAQALLRGYNGQQPDNTFWALKDVSLDVKEGEVLGIIGRNGAGKSTLLKILSRITEPTEGRIEGYGRVGSLLEVGTGFHPELTGRENIYLNGAILGMTRAEINHKFDEIVAFAEIEQFLDTPVKRYSSGMYVRLAFAVAAHLEPEILIVDEVLSVGDAAFQKKCLGKMSAVATQGRTILFVSHNMPAVQSLCDRAIWLDTGRVREEGPAGKIVSKYLQTSFAAATYKVWSDMVSAPGNDRVRLRRACVRPVDGTPVDEINVRTDFVMEFEYWNLKPGAHVSLSLHLYNEQGTLVFNVGPTSQFGWQGKPFPIGLFHDVCSVPGDLLNNGVHQVELMIVDDQEVIYRYEDILIFHVHDSLDFRGGWYDKWEGAVRPVLDWRTERVDPV